MRTIGLLCCICCGLFTNTSNADSWISAQPTVFVSEGGFYTALIIPGSKESPGQLHVYREETPNPSAKLGDIQMQPGESWEDYQQRYPQKWQNDPARQLLWNTKLENEVAPVDVFVSDDGQYVVTLDNWHKVGYGDEVVAFYHKDGLIKKYNLETIIPLPEKIESDSGAIQSNAEMWQSVKFSMPGYFEIFTHSASSRWWRENGIELMTSLDNKNLFGVWLSWKKEWIIWDVKTGIQLADHSKLLGRFNELARKQVLANLNIPESQNDACYFLLYNKNPEDRKLIEEMLTDKNFSTGARSLDGILKCMQAKSYLRCTADMALAIWDGKIDDFTDCWDYDFHSLGSCKGALVLPEVPQKDQSLYIYLVPESVPGEQWSTQPFLQSLSITFDSYIPPNDKEIPFEIFGVTPGRYYIKAIYRKGMKEKYYMPSAKKIFAGQEGDYINSDKLTIDIHPGKVVRKDIVCDREVK